ncbi:NAD(P)-dependent oxidoreductase [Tateyamaria sp. syn59]|uniref:NAD-dependent epimerase/dehydratase family protein n=1 Tax=Tateyamaria sp. syn59 TaxID=2576942 RepID=UPI0011BF325D|nr:NAD(P)-dependent oxidoreductase [Tateyamaria sp. syn59]
MRTVILGAGGKLGRLLRPRWPESVEWTTRKTLDINDAAQLSRALTGADAVFCLAGVTPSSDQPMDWNINLAQQTLDAAQGAHVFLFSSAAVYGALPGALSETGPTSPQSDYATAKLEMERMAHEHSNPCTVLRLGNVAGADAILGGWKQGFTLDRFPDGRTPARSYIGPGRLAQVLHRLARTPDLPPTLNVSAPGAVCMGDLLDAAGLDWEPRPAPARTIAKVHLDTTLVEGIYPFVPTDSTASGIVQDWKTEETV